MKTFVTAAVTAATLLGATGAIAQIRVWEPAEGTFVTQQQAQTTAPVAGSLVGSYYDPVEGKFVTVQPIGETGSNAGFGHVARLYDPVEGKFVTFAPEEPATGAIRSGIAR